MQWQPIETAPRDGAPILVVHDYMGDVSVARWETSGSRGWWQALADGRSAVEYMSDFGTEYVEVAPTHWMPLPPPPGAADE